MSLAAQMNQSTILTSRERERAKTDQQRAEDVIYTLNHTFTCLTITDFAIIPILRGLGFNIGHSHEHHDHRGSHDHGHGHKQHASDLPFWKRVGHWAVGEAIGDIGAAFVTIGVQRFIPGLMDGIRRLIEPVAGGFFHRGAIHAAHTWAERHGLDYSNQEVVDRAQRLYEYEMHHIPQMAMWTLSSIGLHYGAMRWLEKISVAEFGRQKAAGAAITAGLVFGVRALAPDKARRWDETIGRHAIVPLTKKVGWVFGVKEGDVDDYHTRRNGDDAPKNWADKVQAQPEAAAVRG